MNNDIYIRSSRYENLERYHDDCSYLKDEATNEIKSEIVLKPNPKYLPNPQ